MRRLLSGIFVATFAFLGSNCFAANLPKIYAERASCPSLTCYCSEWSVKNNSYLVSKPESSVISGKVTVGEKVTGLVGEVRVKPVKVVITREHKEGKRLFRPGDELFLLQYLFEGIFKGWQNGTTFQVDGTGISGFKDIMREPSAEERWGVIKEDYSNDRWVKVKSSSGQIGWLRQFDLEIPVDVSKCTF